MENKGKRNLIIAIAFVVIYLCSMISIAWYYDGVNKKIDRLTNPETPELVYDFTMLSDTSFHSNLSDQSCLTVTISNDTVNIEPMNTETVGYHWDTHKLWVRCRYTNNWLYEASYDLDTIFTNVPDNAKFNY